MGYIKKLKNNELVGGTDKTTIYPVTSAEAVFEEVIEDGESNFKSQKFLNNNITGDRINKETITDYNIAVGTVTKGKLTPQVQTMLDEGQKKALTPKGNYNPETEYEALDLVFDPLPGTNSSYISLQTPNVGHPVDENAEGYEEGWWEKTLDGTAVNTAQAAIDAKVGQLETQVGNAISQAEQEVYDAKQETLGAYTEAEELAQQITDWSSSEISSTPSYTDQHPLSNRASSAQVGYFECGTSSTTQASNQIKTVTAGGYALPTSGGAVKIKMYAANTYTSTTNNPVKLQFNADATTLKELRYNGEAVSPINTWGANEVISVYYDGQYYQASNAFGIDINNEYVISKTLINHEKRLNKTLSEEEEFTLSKALYSLYDLISSSEDGSNNNVSIVSGNVTYNNSDIIEVISSSYGAGHHELKGKSWVAKISLFSDYAFRNTGIDGANNITHIKGIRNRRPSIWAKYALMVCHENTTASMNVRVKAYDNLCKTLIGMGVTPIVGTQFPLAASNNRELSNALKHYADSNKLMFADLCYYNRNFYSIFGSTTFDLGNHLGTRNSSVESDFYGRMLEKLERPEKSLKVFRLRNSYSSLINDLDNVVFHTNEERAERFKELVFVVRALENPAKVDYRPNGYVTVTNEYTSLYSIGITFTNAALVTAILPCTNQNLTKVSLSANFTGDVHVYAMNVLAPPFPASATYVRFTVMDVSTETPSFGDVYTDGTNNYTVAKIEIGENGSNYTMYCSGVYNEEDPQIGTLTKVGGSGPSSIPYELREQTTSSSDAAVLNDTCGHWVELENVKGEYPIKNISSSVEYDKVSFLITGTSFTMKSPMVNYEGKLGKILINDYSEIEYNEDNSNTELIDESVFGSIGTTLTYWKNSGNDITTVRTYENKYPDGCGSVVNITNEQVMTQSISSKVTSNAPMSLEVWCRYFPDVYSDGSGNQITLDSYDYAYLNVKLGNVTMKSRVSTAWGKIQFEFRNLLNYEAADRKITLSSKDSNIIQIGKVSLKYK